MSSMYFDANGDELPSVELGAGLLKPAQVAELLGLKRSTVEDLARGGVIPSIVLGEHRRFARADVELALGKLRPE